MLLQLAGRQFITTVVSAWLVTTVIFFVLRILPGDPIRAQLAGTGISESMIELRRQELGLDQSLAEQYYKLIVSILSGDLGVSLYSGEAVAEAIGRRLPDSLLLAVMSMLWAIAIGVGLAMIITISTGVIRRTGMMLNSILLSIPVYWSATILVFTVGFTSTNTQPLMIALLPSLVIGIHTAAPVAQLLSAQIDQIKDMDHVRTARSKGLPEREILWRHVLRLAGLPVIHIIAAQTGFIISGAIITESIFQRPGIGSLLLDSILQKDYPMVQGIVWCLALMFVLFQILADFVLMLLDPRMRQTA